MEVERTEKAAAIVLSGPLNAAYREVTAIVKQELEANYSESECETADEVSSIGENYELAKEDQMISNQNGKNFINFVAFDRNLAELHENLRRIVVEFSEAPAELQEIAQKSCKIVENLREKASILPQNQSAASNSQIKSIIDQIRTEKNSVKSASDILAVQERLKILVRDLADVNLVPDFDQISFETPRESMTSLNSIQENELFAKKLKRYQNLQEKQKLVKEASELKSRLAALANCQLNTSDDFQNFTEELEKLCLENSEVRQEIAGQKIRDSVMQNSQTINQWLESELQKEKEDLNTIAEW